MTGEEDESTETGRSALTIAVERRERENSQPEVEATAHTDHTAFSSNPW
ncbi:hypothetical protein [Lentzea sp. NBRC 102530]|nr:hypothetical protein [Lentzea sp. NBRC 102530]